MLERQRRLRTLSRPVEEEGRPVIVTEHGAPLFDISGDGLPLHPQHLETFLARHRSAKPVRVERVDGERVGGGIARCGVSSAIHEAVFRLRDKAFIVDKGAIPEGEKFVLAMACHQVHPGICLTRDQAFYKDALAMAKDVEKFFDSRMVGRFFRILVKPRLESEPYDESVYLYFCHRRERRPHAPVNRMFVVYKPGGSEGFFVPEQLQDGRLTFLNPWSLARRVCRLHEERQREQLGDAAWSCPTLLVQCASHKSIDCAEVRFESLGQPTSLHSGSRGTGVAKKAQVVGLHISLAHSKPCPHPRSPPCELCKRCSMLRFRKKKTDTRPCFRIQLDPRKRTIRPEDRNAGARHMASSWALGFMQSTGIRALRARAGQDDRSPHGPPKEGGRRLLSGPEATGGAGIPKSQGLAGGCCWR